jgi:adenylate cyclase
VPSTPSAEFRERYLEWLTREGATTRSLPELLDGWCRVMNAKGFEIYRCNLATEAIHPLISNTRHVWFPEVTDPGPINPAVVIERRQFEINGAMVDEVLFNTGSQRNPQYLASPFAKVEVVGEIYESVRPSGEPQLFPLFDDLARAGCSAYYARRLDSFAGLLQKFGLSTRRAGGFDDTLLADLRWSIDLLTLHLNTLMEHSAKETLARCYVGVDPGRRVCDGMINRGSIVSDEAVVWFSDLRGFTTIGEGFDNPTLVSSLNDYFDAVVPAIYATGGEVLKYIGDAVLAVFPYRAYADPGAACRAALDAVRKGSAMLERINARREDAGLPLLRHGIGLATGTYSYGNVGSRERLDFTAIGSTVNLASRVESLTKELSRPVLFTRPLHSLSQGDGEYVGSFRLKGLADPVDLYAPLSLDRD